MTSQKNAAKETIITYARNLSFRLFYRLVDLLVKGVGANQYLDPFLIDRKLTMDCIKVISFLSFSQPFVN